MILDSFRNCALLCSIPNLSTLTVRTLCQKEYQLIYYGDAKNKLQIRTVTKICTAVVARYAIFPRILARSNYSREAIISNIAHWKSCPKYFVLLSH